MFPCAGSNVDLVARLQNRMKDVEHHVTQKEGYNQFKHIYDGIESAMNNLKLRLGSIKRSEDAVMKILNTVTRDLDELLEYDFVSGKPDFWKSKLERIKDLITDKITEAIDKAQAAQHKEESDEAHEREELDELFPLERKLEESPTWAHLKLVVDSMEKQLKLCLFTLSVFPPNAVIKKRLLFHWWMAEEFVGDPMEGNECFNQLIDKAFVIPLKKRHCDKWHYCKVQVWLRRLIIDVAASNAFLEYDDVSRWPSSEYTRSPRACLSRNRQLIRREEEVDADRRLKVIYNVSCRDIELSADWLVNKSGLVAMQLGRWKEASPEDKALHVEVKSNEFLQGIGSCQKLKYVSLRGVSRVEKLGKSIGNLDNLVVLDLRACHNLEKLPEEVGSAKKLQFLDVSECYLLDQMPKSLASLNELQVLKGFVVGDFQNKNICQIVNLIKLRNLRKLSINLGRELKDDEVASLRELKELTSLAIVWGVVFAGGKDKSQSGDEEAQDMQEAQDMPPPGKTEGRVLALPPKLTKLELWCFPNKNLPEWISHSKLPNLEKLYIRGGMLHTLGDEKWRNVKVLRLRFLNHFAQDWQNLSTAFPDLKYVTASACPLLVNLVKWPFCPPGPEEADEEEEVNFRPDEHYWYSNKET